MIKEAKAAMKRTGKKYGGIIHQCQFLHFDLKEPIQGRMEVECATGNLFDDPNNRFGFRGNFGMRTSYIVNKTDKIIETRNTIYEYTLD